MDFKELLDANTEMFESWKKDEVLNEYYATENELKRAYLNCIQQAIDSNFRLFSESEIDDINEILTFKI
jgi:hypothetical protein